MAVNKHWRDFTKNLAACIGALSEDEYLIIARKGANQYVQFAGQGAYGIRAEAAGNGYIEPPELLLDERQYARMQRLGWSRPTALPDEPCALGSPNFFTQMLPTEVGLRELARRTTQTFRTVYGVAHPGMLHYEAFHSQGTSIRFPTLLIKRRVPEPVTPRIERWSEESDDLELDHDSDMELGFD
ncbi:TY-Chap domain-containing protein [Gemmatimonas phototrophica]|uniref:TY-Chap N-terminal domain-containing protein n=1 Tax=Gemmatimonas phototrophica TaxID=1379270 RepID=A0A143BGV9_9BACT|nr:hypothetical protein [Gemmatimonas phototrophica]AMW03732.1 hypothetical protein GEMMAAP_00470 [Gemmatimonas phototrophica]